MSHDLQRVGRGRIWRWAAVAVIAVVAAAAALAYRYGYPDAADLFTNNLQIRQITHSSAEYSVTGGAISPDGRQVVYADARGIHLLDPDTGDTHRIDGTERPPAGGSWELTPGWRPDGREFVANLVTGGGVANSSIWMSTPSGPPRLIREHARALSVSPDDAWLAFSTDGNAMGDRDVWIMRPDGTGARKLFDAAHDTRIVGLSWSPDGTRVAYLRIDNTGDAVAVDSRDLLGNPATEIITPREHEVLHGATWLRDGRVLYSLREPARTTSGGAAPCSHWQIALDAYGRPDGAPRPLAGWLPQCVSTVSFTSDSTRAIYVQAALHDAIHIVDVDAAGARVQARRLTFTEGRNIPSGWAQDGSVVFLSDSMGRAALVSQRPGADMTRVVTDVGGIAGAARLTPDGADVLFLASSPFRSTTRRIMRVPVAGGDPAEVVEGIFIDGGARCAVAPAQLCAIAERHDDGKQVIFSALNPMQGRGAEIARVDGTDFADLRWALSPDGTRIAVADARGSHIRILLLEGLASESITLAGQHHLGYVSFTSDSRGVIVPSVTDQGASLLSVSLSGATAVLWEQPGATDISGIPSRDGRQVAVWVRSRKASLWMAEIP